MPSPLMMKAALFGAAWATRTFGSAGSIFKRAVMRNVEIDVAGAANHELTADRHGNSGAAVSIASPGRMPGNITGGRPV